MVLESGEKMFDPTIYDNIKVVLEGEIYDLDLSGKITVTERKDLIDLALMTRTFMIKYKLVDKMKESYVKIILHASTIDLAKEILENVNGEKPGCEIKIKFYIDITEPEEKCKRIEGKLNEIWDFRPKINQRLSYTYKSGESGTVYNDEITLNFGRKIDEDNIEDLHDLLEFSLLSLKEITKL